MLVEVTGCEFGYAPGIPVVRVEGAARVCRGECLGIYGPNGVGKSTLVRGLLGLLAPMDGTVRRDAAARRGYLSQHRTVDRHWPMTACDVAMLATSARRRFGWCGGCEQRVRRSLDVLSVGDLADRPFAQLSGGQQQRVLLAGTLADEPDLLVLDEPTDGLDDGSRNVLLRVLRDAIRGGLGAVLVSHDVHDIIALCGSVLWIEPAGQPDEPSLARVVPAASLGERFAAGRAR